LICYQQSDFEFYISEAFFPDCYFRILCNYEISPGSITLSNELIDHAKENKESVMTHNISSHTLTRAVAEVFNGECTKTRIQREGNKISYFKNLKRREMQPQLQPLDTKNYQKEWEELKTGASDTTTFENLKWTVITDKEGSLSFGRIESVSYDKKRVVSELRFFKNDIEKTIEISAMYHERGVPTSHLNSIELQFKDCRILDKARHLMDFLDKSYICHGFSSQDNELKETPMTACTLKTHVVSIHDEDLVEERIFSNECEVLTNSSGRLCSKCNNAKKNFNRRTRTKREMSSSFSKNTNNRYLSREELILKNESQRKKRLAEKRMREKIQ